MKLWTMLMGVFGGQQPSGFSTDSPGYSYNPNYHNPYFKGANLDSNI